MDTLSAQNVFSFTRETLSGQRAIYSHRTFSFLSKLMETIRKDRLLYDYFFRLFINEECKGDICEGNCLLLHLFCGRPFARGACWTLSQRRNPFRVNPAISGSICIHIQIQPNELLFRYICNVPKVRAIVIKYTNGVGQSFPRCAVGVRRSKWQGKLLTQSKM